MPTITPLLVLLLLLPPLVNFSADTDAAAIADEPMTVDGEILVDDLTLVPNTLGGSSSSSSSLVSVSSAFGIVRDDGGIFGAHGGLRRSFRCRSLRHCCCFRDCCAEAFTTVAVPSDAAADVESDAEVRSNVG